VAHLRQREFATDRYEREIAAAAKRNVEDGRANPK